MSQNGPPPPEGQDLRSPFVCQTTSSLACCVQGSSSPSKTQLHHFTAVFPNQSLLLGYLIKSSYSIAGAKFQFVNHCFWNGVEELGWEMREIPLHWKPLNKQAGGGGSWTAGTQLGKAIPREILLKKNILWLQNPHTPMEENVFVNSSETFGYVTALLQAQWVLSNLRKKANLLRAKLSPWAPDMIRRLLLW